MTLFQIVVISALSALVVRELARFLRGDSRLSFCIVKTSVWTAAALAVAIPELVQTLASFVGIGRGTDIVLYVFALAFLGTTFYFYSRYILLQRQITQLVRLQALENAARGEPTERFDDVRRAK